MPRHLRLCAFLGVGFVASTWLLAQHITSPPTTLPMRFTPHSEPVASTNTSGSSARTATASAPPTTLPMRFTPHSEPVASINTSGSSAHTATASASGFDEELASWRCGEAAHATGLAAAVARAHADLEKGGHELALLPSFLDGGPTGAGCVQGWCEIARGRKKLILAHFEQPLLVMKVTATALIRELREEREAMSRTCKAASASGARVTIPWTSVPFVVGGANRTAILLQQRLPREGAFFRVRDGSTFVDALFARPRDAGDELHSEWAAAAAQSYLHLIAWERVLRLRSLLISDLQFHRSAISGQLWLLDAMETVPVRPQLQAHLRGLRRPEEPGRAGSGNGGALCKAYVAARQRASLLSFALLSALVAEGDVRSVDGTLCAHGSCELGCLLVGLTASARATLAASSLDGLQDAVRRLDSLVGPDGGGFGAGSSRGAVGGAAAPGSGGSCACDRNIPEAFAACYIAGGEGYLAHELALQCTVADSSAGNCPLRRANCARGALCSARSRHVVAMQSSVGKRIMKSEWMAAVYGDHLNSSLRFAAEVQAGPCMEGGM